MGYRQRYADMTDEQLLTLADQKNTLVDSARQALEVELSCRNLRNMSLNQYGDEEAKRIETQIVNSGPVTEGKWVRVTVPTGRVQFPSVCPSCFKPKPDRHVSIRSEAERSKFRVLYRKIEYTVIAVPHCKSCARSFKLWRKVLSGSILLGIAAAAAIAIKFDIGRGAGFLLAVALCGPGIFASTYLKRSVRLVNYDDKWMDFAFKSFDYATTFHHLNTGGESR